jgi:hypothetical protein
MEKSTFLGLKDGKIKYKTQNLDSLDTHFCACGSGCCGFNPRQPPSKIGYSLAESYLF